MESNFFARLSILVRILTLIVFSAEIFSFLLIGTTSRYVQDDYCYAYYLSGENFWQEQIASYTQERPYSGNRYALSLGVGFSELAGADGTALLPGLTLICWVFGTYLLIKNMPRLQKRLMHSSLDALILSEAVVLFTLSLTQDWVQSYFWRSGMLPYLAPLVTGTYLIWFIIKSSQKENYQWMELVGVFLLAVISGGFSEIGNAVLLTLISILLVLSVILHKRKPILPLVTALIGGLLALVLLIAAPMNMQRLQSPAYENAFNFITAIKQSLDGSIFFYQATAYRMTLMYLSVLIFFVLLGILFAHDGKTEIILSRKIITMLGLVIAVSFILTFASMIPTYLTEASYPKHRALIIPRYISILLALVVGFGVGRYIFSRLPVQIQRISLVVLGLLIVSADFFWLTGKSQYYIPPPYPEIIEYIRSHLLLSVAVVLIAALVLIGIVTKVKPQIAISIMILLYLFQPAAMTARIFSEYPILRERAALWDSRESQIIRARENGTGDITVRAFDSFVGLTELSDNPGVWVNRCAALYYGVNSIRAVEPVLDPVRFENP